jgi:DNA-binding NarL/FixJ family response regulator
VKSDVPGGKGQSFGTAGAGACPPVNPFAGDRETDVIVFCSAHPAVRQHWRRGLDKEARIVEIGEWRQLVAFLEKHPDALVLLHLGLADMKHVDGARELKKAFPEVRIMAFSDVPDDTEGLALLRIGIFGYANTLMKAELLQRAVASIRAGEVWVGRKLMRRLIENIAAPSVEDKADSTRHRLDALTPRELQIAELVAGGASNKQIASRLDVTERTVKAHLSAVFRKTGTRDRLQLALLVSENT